MDCCEWLSTDKKDQAVFVSKCGLSIDFVCEPKNRMYKYCPKCGKKVLFNGYRDRNIFDYTAWQSEVQ
jgi:hypothetical protein